MKCEKWIHEHDTSVGQRKIWLPNWNQTVFGGFIYFKRGCLHDIRATSCRYEIFPVASYRSVFVNLTIKNLNRSKSDRYKFTPVAAPNFNYLRYQNLFGVKRGKHGLLILMVIGLRLELWEMESSFSSVAALKLATRCSPNIQAFHCWKVQEFIFTSLF